MILAAFVSFCGLLLVLHHMSRRNMRRLVGYKGVVDILVHGTVIALFIGTSTYGLIQAEAAALMFSIYVRVYRWAFGYERMKRFRWVRYAGKFC